MSAETIAQYSARKLNRLLEEIDPLEFADWSVAQLDAARHVAASNWGRRLGWPPLALSFTLVLGIAAGQGLQLWANPVILSAVLLLCLLLGSVLGNLARWALGAPDAEFLEWRLQPPGDLGPGEPGFADVLLNHPACAQYASRLRARGRQVVRHDLLFLRGLRRRFEQAADEGPARA